jgi:DNA-binding response OmpR family regulator
VASYILLTDGTRKSAVWSLVYEQMTSRWPHVNYERATKEHSGDLQQAEAILVKRGHRVERATSVAEVKRLLQEGLPDVLVVDSALDDGGPPDVIEALRECPGWQATQVVFLTQMSNKSEEGPIVFADDSLVDLYVMRPCCSWQIVLGVEQCLRPRRSVPSDM